VAGPFDIESMSEREFHDKPDGIRHWNVLARKAG
jgi:hypothetical protein